MTIRVKIKAHEIEDADISKISLVKRGANRTPFKIIKTEDTGATGQRVNLHERHLDELVKLEELGTELTVSGRTRMEMRERIMSRSRISNSTPPGGNYQSPGTAGEVAADSASQQADRGKVRFKEELQARLQVLEAEAHMLVEGSHSRSPEARSRLLQLDREIAAINAVLQTQGVVKTEDDFDRVVGQHMANLRATSQVLDEAPTQISKAERQQQAEFWRDLAADIHGVRRAQRSPVEKRAKSEDEFWREIEAEGDGVHLSKSTQPRPLAKNERPIEGLDDLSNTLGTRTRTLRRPS